MIFENFVKKLKIYLTIIFANFLIKYLSYILYGLEADESLTGGTFYSDQQLDSEFVQTLIHVCTNWLLVIFDIFVNLIENILKQRARQAEELHRSDPVAQREASFVLSEEVLF